MFRFMLICSLILTALACDAPSGSASTQPAADAARQPQRLQLIRDLQKREIFGEYKITSEKTGRVVVKPSFAALPFESKKKFCSVVLAWMSVEQPGTRTLVLVDHLSGKTVGTFDLAGDLDLK